MRTNPIIFTFLTFFLLSSPAQAFDNNKLDVGAGSYALSLTDQTITQTFSGVALIIDYTINDYVDINSHIYRMIDDSIQDMSGYDLALRLGKFTPGFNAFVQGGIYSETLSSSTSSATKDFSDTFLGVGVGYKWSHISIILDVSRRATKDYQGTSSANIDAATRSLSISF